MIKTIRWTLGRIILVLNNVFSPKGLQRTPEAQQEVNNAVATMKLYQFETCPFCVKVRRHAKRLNLPLETRDAKVAHWEQELIEQGGKRKVPCLRIDDGEHVTWMYESDDIVKYLQQRFS